MNDIIEMFYKLNNTDELLIEYELFFSKLKGYCFFVIDDAEELEELNSIISHIKSIDDKARVFCSTYGVDRINEQPYIYCDCLWIRSNMSINEIVSLFLKYDKVNHPLRTIVPSNISILSQEEMADNCIKYIICKNGEIHNSIDGKDGVISDDMIILYWD